MNTNQPTNNNTNEKELPEEEFNKIVVDDGSGNYYLTVKLQKKVIQDDKNKSVLELKSIVDRLYNEVNIPVTTSAPASAPTDNKLYELKTFVVTNPDAPITKLDTLLEENKEWINGDDYETWKSESNISNITDNKNNLVDYIEKWKSKNTQQTSIKGGRRIPSQRRKSLRSKSGIHKSMKRGYSKYGSIKKATRRSLPITRKNMYSSYLY